MDNDTKRPFTKAPHFKINTRGKSNILNDEINKKRKNPDFSGSHKTECEDLVQVSHLSEVKRPKSGITSSKPKMLKSKSIDEEAPRKEFRDRLEKHKTLQTRSEIKKPKTSIASSPSILPDTSDRWRISKKKNGNQNRSVLHLKLERQPIKNKTGKNKMQVSDVYLDGNVEESLGESYEFR
ncbi:unnamed protein product [Clavelina lepadiformis]|uniref:Uncharacterized protein n=1 Tax=Clavelina lepadiformis TaxID=159417 RepID=A0ABP0FKM3_CLALP